MTDSLLWGGGHEQSDIDLVVVGRDPIAKLQSKLSTMYDGAFFRRPDPEQMQAPYGLDVEGWSRILSRKLHMGQFDGRLFSVRGMLHESECAHGIYQPPDQRLEQSETMMEFHIADARDSLLFPATYRNEQGDELVDYSVVYEGVFRPGETVACRCIEERQLETYSVGHSEVAKRYVINGPVEF